MEEIIDPISRDALKSELTKERFVRNTGNGSNEIYFINCHNAPQTLLEVGRLREVSFRTAGGGTGKKVDLDEYDYHDKHPYEQLVVWDPEAEEILGGYRFIFCRDTRDEKGNYHLATTELFDFSDKFKNEYSPYILELGRSFVQPKYQSRNAGKKGIYALDNLWDGLGALVSDHPWIKYFYGKVTMYSSYDTFARDLILFLMKKHFGDKEGLVIPKVPLLFHHDEAELAAVLTSDNLKEDMKIVQQQVRNRGEFFPPLISSYINLSPTMKSFGTALNATFGNVEETGILVKVEDIYPERRDRYVTPYKKFKGII